MYKFEK